MNWHRLTLMVTMIPLLACGSQSSDISTFMQSDNNPLDPCPESPNCVRISTSFEADADTLYNAIGSALKDIGSDTLDQNHADHSYHAVFKIPVFGWKDDVHIKVDSTGQQSIAYIRSASRIGYSDLGVNRRRVKKLLKQINKTLNLN